MKKILRLTLALLLIISLVLTSLIFASAATSSVGTLDAFLAAIADTSVETIELTNNITLSEQLNIERSVKISGNGKTITGYIQFGATDKTVIYVDNVNLVGTSGKGDVFKTTGTVNLTFSDCTIKSTGTSSGDAALWIQSSTTNAVVRLLGGVTIDTTGGSNIGINLSSGATGTLIIDGATIKTKGGKAVNNQSPTRVEILSGNISTNNQNVVNVSASSSGDLIIGKPNGTGPSMSVATGGESAVYIVGNGTNEIRFYGGTITHNGTGKGIYLNGEGQLLIQGGEFTSAQGPVLQLGKGSTKIIGGEFIAPAGSSNNLIYNTGSSAVIVTGGKFTNNGSGTPIFNDKTLKIAGGTYNFNPSEYVVTNYAATLSNGTYSVATSLGTPVTLTNANLADVVASKPAHIKLGENVTLGSALTLDFDTYVDGNGFSFSGQQILVNSSAVVTLKNVKLTKSGDAIKVLGSGYLVIDGGEFNSTSTSGNNGALYLTNAFTGLIDVIGGTKFGGSRLAFYNGGDAPIYKGGVVNFKNCTLDSTGYDILKFQSHQLINIGNGDPGETVTIGANSGTGDRLYWTNNSIRRTDVNIYDGAVIKGEKTFNVAGSNTLTQKPILNICGGTISSGDESVLYAKTYPMEVNIYGGKITGVNNYSVLYVECEDSSLTIAGGTIVGVGSGKAVNRSKGDLIITGGTFSVENADVSTIVSSSNAGIVFIDGEDVKVNSDRLFFEHNAACTTVVKNLALNQNATIIKADDSAGAITLNNCQLTSADSTIISASSAVIRLENYTLVSSTGGEPISGGTVETDTTSSVGESNIHPLVEAIKFDTDGIVEVNQAYIDVPVITIDKDITFTGTGSIAFQNGGFEVKGADVVFAEGSNINVTMGADDKDGTNRLFNLTNGATLTLSGGTFTGYIRLAGTSSQSAREKVTVNDGATLIQKNWRIFDVSNGYNEVVINGGTFKGSSNDSPMLRMNDSSAVLKIYGGTFNYSGTDVIMNIGNVGTLEVGKLATDTEEAKGPTMTTSGTDSLICYFNTSSGIQNASAVVNFNAGKFTQNAYGYNIYFNKDAKAPININGGTWTTQWLATVYVNDGDIADLRINGGTFETKNGDEQTVYKKNGALTVTGGHFISNGKAASICSAPDTTVGAFTVNDAANDISNITFKHSGSGALLEHRSAVDFNIIDTNITSDSIGAGVLIEKRTNANVTIENSNITTAGSALALGSDFTGATDATVEVINSTLTSTGSRGVDNKWGVVANGLSETDYYRNIPNFTMDSTSKINDSAELRTNGKPKMFRFAGGSGSANLAAVSATTASLASGTYTLTLNYRETGGAWPYVGVTAGGKTTAVPKANFVDGVMTYTFSAEGEVKVSLGRETMHAAGAVYFGNVKLTANGSSTNLLDSSTFDNGDLALSPINTLTAGNAGAVIPGWTNENLGSFHGARVMEIPSEDFFTAGNPKVAENYVYKFEDGDNLDVLLRFHMTEDTNYEFSYNYMSSDGNLRSKLFQGGMDRPFSMNIEQDEDSYKTIVKYTLGNDGDSTVENEGTTIYIDGPEDAYGSIQYLGNFEMYEIDGAGNRITGRNLLAGFSPMYETEGDLSHLGTYPMVIDSAVSSKLENAYGVYFRNDSSETDVASIVKVDDNFFKKSSFAERRGNARRYLIKNDSHTDLAYDYSADKAVNVIDLLKVKKYESGFVGADDKAEQLKADILGTGNTTPTNSSKVYYVSNSGSDSYAGTKDKPFATLAKAISKVGSNSGYTILLERGGEWRMPSSTSGNGWTLTKGVTIGSYGTGEKPVLIGSAYNYAEKTWTEVSDNIWKITLEKKASANIPGNLYFFTNKTDEEPSLVGTIVKDNSPIGQTWNTSTDEWDKVNKTPAEILSRNGEVYRDYDSEEADWLQQWFGGSGQKNDVYVYYDGNLTEDFKKIEITESRDLIFAESVSGITIDNIAIKFVGAHGINLKTCSDATISNCEIGWIGGAPSGNSALGNGIQFGVSGTNLIATHNYIYQCYDAGITPQNWKTSDYTSYNFANVQITNNLLTNNFDNIEFWNDDGAMEMKVDGNILKDAAYCWSWNQRIKTGNLSMFGCHIYGGRNAYNNQLKLEFTNNIFDNTQANIFCWFWGNKDNAAELPDTFPTSGSHYMILSGNSYYQNAGSNEGGQVNYYGNTTERTFASSQKGFEDAVRVLDPDAANAGRVTYLQQWLTDLAEQGDNEMVYNDITINNAKISGNINSDDNYVIVNDTTTEYGTLAVNSLIKEVTGEYLAVADSVSVGDKAIRIITDTALAPNTVKVYVTGNTLYIAAHDTLFVDDAISVFKGILADGKLTFANSYKKTITLSSYTYSGKSGLRLIGDSDKNPVSYNVGETATINLGAYSSGSNQIVSVPQFKVTVYNEATGKTTTTTYTGTDGVCSFDVACKDAQGNGVAGFVYWTVVACDSNGNKISGFTEVDSGVHYSGSVGFGVKSIAKSSDKPTNFDSNWAAAASEVAGVALDIDNIATGNDSTGSKIEMESVSANSGYKAYRVEIPYANAGGFVTGYLTYPENAGASSLGLMVRFQGNSVAAPDKNYDANAAVFTICAHSLDLTKTGDSTYMTNFKNSINKNGNNFAWDNSTFDTSYLVKMVKRDLLASKFMIEYFGEDNLDLWNGTSFTAMGTSMGGFQSIAVAALLDDVTGKKVTTLNVSLPWLCDLGAETSGNNRKDSTWRPTYAYADTVHFATMLGNVDQIIVNAGLGDVICPASGVMAFYNTISNNNKSITFRQNNTHGGGYDGAYYTIVG